MITTICVKLRRRYCLMVKLHHLLLTYFMLKIIENVPFLHLLSRKIETSFYHQWAFQIPIILDNHFLQDHTTIQFVIKTYWSIVR